MTQSIFTRKYEHLRRLIVEARHAAGLTQANVARKLGKPQSFVSKYELGERRLDVIEFIEVANAIGIEPSALLEKLDGPRVRKGR